MVPNILVDVLVVEGVHYCYAVSSANMQLPFVIIRYNRGRPYYPLHPAMFLSCSSHDCWSLPSKVGYFHTLLHTQKECGILRPMVLCVHLQSNQSWSFQPKRVLTGSSKSPSVRQGLASICTLPLYQHRIIQRTVSILRKIHDIGSPVFHREYPDDTWSPLLPVPIHLFQTLLQYERKHVSRSHSRFDFASGAIVLLLVFVHYCPSLGYCASPSRPEAHGLSVSMCCWEVEDFLVQPGSAPYT